MYIYSLWDDSNKKDRYLNNIKFMISTFNNIEPFDSLTEEIKGLPYFFD